MTENNNSKDGLSTAEKDPADVNSKVPEKNTATKEPSEAKKAKAEKDTTSKSSFFKRRKKTAAEKSLKAESAISGNKLNSSEKFRTLSKKTRFGIVGVMVCVGILVISAALMPSAPTKASKKSLSQLCKSNVRLERKTAQATKNSKAAKVARTVEKTKKSTKAVKRTSQKTTTAVEIARPGDIDKTSETLARLRKLGFKASAKPAVATPPRTVTSKLKLKSNLPVSKTALKPETKLVVRTSTAVKTENKLDDEQALQEKLAKLFPKWKKSAPTNAVMPAAEAVVSSVKSEKAGIENAEQPASATKTATTDEDTALNTKLAKLFPNRRAATGTSTSLKVKAVEPLKLQINEPAQKTANVASADEDTALNTKLAKLFPNYKRVATPLEVKPAVDTSTNAVAVATTAEVVVPKPREAARQTPPATQASEKPTAMAEIAVLKQQITKLQKLIEQQLAEKQHYQRLKTRLQQTTQVEQPKQTKATTASLTEDVNNCKEAGQISKNGKTWMLMLCGDRVHEVEL